MKKHIVSFSGGKDSTAMLLMMLKNNILIDEIIFIDTTAEYKSMYKHIEKVKNEIDMDITKLTFPYSFDYYMKHYEKQRGKSKGAKGYGWCGANARWGTTIKKQMFAKYIRQKYNNNIIEYQGIAFDEQERLDNNPEKKWEVKYPLADMEFTEAMALKYCYKKGYTWDGLYENLDRVSCWCCRNKNLKELKNIMVNMPDTWEALKELEQEINEPYYQREIWLWELEKRFTIELKQITWNDLLKEKI